MTEPTQLGNTPSKGVWVRLHLERQSDSSFMPPYVTGYLTSQSATHYVLTKSLEPTENEDTYEIVFDEVAKHQHINKTYVWNCEVLGDAPIAPVYNGSGGLG